MATLEQVKRMIKDNSTLEIARENVSLEAEERKSKEQIKAELRKLIDYR